MNLKQYEGLTETERLLINQIGIPYDALFINYVDKSLEVSLEYEYLFEIKNELFNALMTSIFEREEKEINEKRRKQTLDKEDTDNLQAMLNVYKDSLNIEDQIFKYVNENKKEINPLDVCRRFPINQRQANMINDINFDNIVKVPIELTIKKDLVINLDDRDNLNHVLKMIDDDINNMENTTIKISKDNKKPFDKKDPLTNKTIFLDELQNIVLG